MHAHSHHPFRASVVVATAAVLTAGVLSARTVDARRAAPIMFEAVAVRDNVPSEPARITLDRWSTDAERNALMATVASRETSPDAVEAAISTMAPIGTFRTISGLSNEIRYAREFLAADGSRRLVLVTDQDVVYWDGEDGATPEQHPYTLIEVRFAPGADAGEGKISHTRLELGDMNTQLDFGQFDAAPVSLIGVRQLASASAPTVDPLM